MKSKLLSLIQKEQSKALVGPKGKKFPIRENQFRKNNIEMAIVDAVLNTVFPHIVRNYGMHVFTSPGNSMLRHLKLFLPLMGLTHGHAAHKMIAVEKDPSEFMAMKSFWEGVAPELRSAVKVMPGDLASEVISFMMHNHQASRIHVDADHTGLPETVLPPLLEIFPVLRASSLVAMTLTVTLSFRGRENNTGFGYYKEDLPRMLCVKNEVLGTLRKAAEKDGWKVNKIYPAGDGILFTDANDSPMKHYSEPSDGKRGMPMVTGTFIIFHPERYEAWKVNGHTWRSKWVSD